MTLTRWCIDDVGGALPWARLSHFLHHLPDSSATKREVLGDVSPWVDGRKIAPILADIFDAINLMRYEYAVSLTPKNKPAPDEPKPYPRPDAERDKPRDPFDYDALRARLYG